MRTSGGLSAPALRNALHLIVLSLLIGTALSARAALIGPTPYLSSANSPFFPLNGFFLEDFEDGLLNTPGVSAVGTGICVTNRPGCFPNDPAVDSVDADNGAIDGNGGLPGHSLFGSAGNAGIAFVFDAAVLGGLPTAAGIVWTDGGTGPGNLITFEAFDQNGLSLGTLTGNHADLDNSGAGSTAEDRFYGVTHAGGISRIVLRNAVGGIEMDHLQYNFVPAPSTLWLLGIAFAALGFLGLRRQERLVHPAPPEIA